MTKQHTDEKASERQPAESTQDMRDMISIDIFLSCAAQQKCDIATLKRVLRAVTSGLYKHNELIEMASDALKQTE